MSEKKKEPDTVNRLLDILVEEVSLVDNAANKHRFLVVKRSEEMEDNSNNTTGSPSDISDETSTETTTDSDTNGVDESNINATQSGQVSDTLESDTDDTALSITVEALANLANAVEVLNATYGEDTAAAFSKITEQLQGVEDKLSNVTTKETEKTDETDDIEDLAAQVTQEEQPNKSEKENPSIATVIESVRSTLQQINAKLNASSKNDKSTSNEVSPQSGLCESRDEQVIKQLAALTGELQKLNGSFKAQQKRLVQLEKQFGLPNSTPKSEGSQRNGDDNVSWPTDLNSSFDRDSVEKSVSFYEV